MKELGAALEKLGFRTLNRKTFACRAGDLVHAVFVTKDRYGCYIVSVLVCLPSFFKEGEELSVDNLQSPLCGDVSPRGVIESWAWEKGALEINFVVSVIMRFFMGFSTTTDVRRALNDLYVSPYFAELLPLDAPPPQSVLALPEPCYPVHGGALSLNEITDRSRRHLIMALAPLGFKSANTSDVVAIRRRGEMFDAVRVMPDSFGTFLTLTCFPWPTAVWRVDKRWKDIFYPMLSFDIIENGKLFLLLFEDFIGMDPKHLLPLLEDGIRRSGEVHSHLDFADQLNSDWSTMVAKLRRIPE